MVLLSLIHWPPDAYLIGGSIAVQQWLFGTLDANHEIGQNLRHLGRPALAAQ
jgi:hypothetical protein